MCASPRLMMLAAVLAGLFAGCGFGGGRGSSGFEIRENAIIQQVLDTQQCVSGMRLTFCPADRRASGVTPTPTATAPTQGPTATRTPDPAPRVDTQLANGASIACTRSHPGAPCSLTFSFSGFGFPSGTTFRVASRLRAPDFGWSLAAAPLPSGDTAGTFDTPVLLDVPADLTEASLQFAVLAFLASPGAVPATFDTLAQSGADFGFVTPVFALEVITIGPPPTTTLTATPTPTLPLPSVSPTLPAPTPTATIAVPAVGPEITYFGVARADGLSLAPSSFDPSGRPIYVRPFGHGLSVIVEGHPGANRRPIGASAYTPGAPPFLQVILSRPIGDGSAVVCDNLQPDIGGVPAAVPFAFGDGTAVVDAMNDLGCRVDDGTGIPRARVSSNACTLDRLGDYRFVDDRSSAQFCLPIAAQWAFPPGDTVVAARLRDVVGGLGPERQIVVRNLDTTAPTPVPTAAATRTRTGPPVATSTAAPSSPTPSVTSTAPTRTPTPTTLPGVGPSITYFGVALADNRPLTPVGTDDDGRLVFASRTGFGISLIVEAAPGTSRRRVGPNAYSDAGLPDLQLIVSRPLGNGSGLVCDDRPPLIGGVPATSPLRFSDDPAQVGVVNDLGCRVDDGQGNPVGRVSSNNACTANEGAEYVFQSFASSIQYCLPIAGAWAFPRGDTIVAARARDEVGQVGGAQEIVVRVGR
ncbi:MAG: hypothetical protein ACRERC_06040 [Candidatus Binatia bacterium]